VPLIATVPSATTPDKLDILYERAAGVSLARLFNYGASATVQAVYQRYLNKNSFIEALADQWSDGGRVAALRELDGALVMVQQLALGLQHMQERYFTHRDLKPDNLFLDGDAGVLRILDMGLACHNAEVLNKGMRRSGWSKPCQDLSLQCAATQHESDDPGPWLGCSFDEMAGNKRYRSPHVHFSAAGGVTGALKTAVMGAVAARDLRLLEGARGPRTRGIHYWSTIAMTRGHDSE